MSRFTGCKIDSGPNEIHTISADLGPGDKVQVIEAAFHGFKAVVAQVMPAARRVAALLDLLGRQTRFSSAHSKLRAMAKTIARLSIRCPTPRC